MIDSYPLPSSHARLTPSRAGKRVWKEREEECHLDPLPAVPSPAALGLPFPSTCPRERIHWAGRRGRVHFGSFEFIWVHVGFILGFILVHFELILVHLFLFWIHFASCWFILGI